MRGLFGGSFNPPHIGHLAVAEACAEAAGLDEVVWMPAATPPHKLDDLTLAPARARLTMVEAAIAGNDRFRASDLEIERADGSPSFTVDTLRTLTADGSAWALLIGGDSYRSFPRWREPEAIADMARIIVYRRPGSPNLGPVPEWLARRTTVVDGPSLDISSTELRARLAAGRSVRYLVPDSVRDVIGRLKLYGASERSR